uniref:Uncharacterized protein n=1 Tax=Oryza punctata TaxID=4537 RepID=A0A0E0MQ38_ORYPU
MADKDSDSDSDCMNLNYLRANPSTFATLAMDPVRKQEIINDLHMFRDGKDYYASQRTIDD